MHALDLFLIAKSLLLLRNPSILLRICVSAVTPLCLVCDLLPIPLYYQSLLDLVVRGLLARDMVLKGRYER